MVRPGDPAPRVTAYVAIGANLGDARATVQAAVNDLQNLPHTRVLCASSLYQTAPMDSTGPDYINAVAAISTGLSPHELLAALQSLEQAAGRQRPYLNAPRTLDLDIVLYGDTVMTTGELVIPHPRMWQRAFVLLPLAEIAPNLVSSAQRLAVSSQAIAKI
jgi:2-amino-4-hydroxy-6-hydroxymethyldihydropteridine diphosphokinase